MVRYKRILILLEKVLRPQPGIGPLNLIRVLKHSFISLVHALPLSRNCTPQNTELYGIQYIFYCLQMYFMVYKHPFVELLYNYKNKLSENYLLWQFTINVKWKDSICTLKIGVM